MFKNMKSVSILPSLSKMQLIFLSLICAFKTPFHVIIKELSSKRAGVQDGPSKC